MTALKGLGRGFESLIPTDLVDEEFDLTASEEKGELKKLKLSDIVPDDEQPRREFDEEALNALATSIKEHGVLQPIVVTREDGKYKIVAGERRWRASKIAGLDKIPAIVRSLDSQNRLDENIAAKVGKSEASIIGTLRLLNLPDEAKKIMVKEKLTEGVMRPLVSQDEEIINKVLPKIVEEGWTARRVERYLQDNRKKSSAALLKTRKNHKDEDALAKKYGTTVKISGKSLTFKCKTKAELESLIKSLL